MKTFGWTYCYSIPQQVTIVTAVGRLTFSRAVGMIKDVARLEMETRSRGLIVDLREALLVLEAADMGPLRDAIVRAWGKTKGLPLAIVCFPDAARLIPQTPRIRAYSCLTVMEAVSWIDHVCRSKPSARDLLIRKIVRIISLLPDDRLSTLADGLADAVELLQPAHRMPSSEKPGHGRTPLDPEAPS